VAFLTGQPGVGTLILVRHGQQEWPQGRNQPASEWIDPPLSPTGQRQAETVGEALASEPVAAVYSSHLQRAAETGRQIAKHHGLEPTVLEELREIEVFRDLPDGVSIRDAVSETTMLGMQQRFIQERRWDCYPFSETSAEFEARIVTTIEGILAAHPAETVAVACHGGVINTFVGHQLRLREDMFFRPAHASVTRVLVGDGRRVILTLNEVHHLRAIDPALVTC
jgi:broad specificity phosphatase PhoE